MCRGKKCLSVVTMRRLAVVLLLSGGALLWVQHSQAFSSPQDDPSLDERVRVWADASLRARILNRNPDAESYLTFNPFTMSEIRSTVASPDPAISGEDASLLSGSITIICLPRPPVRVPVRPPLRSPCVPLP